MKLKPYCPLSQLLFKAHSFYIALWRLWHSVHILWRKAAVGSSICTTIDRICSVMRKATSIALKRSNHALAFLSTWGPRVKNIVHKSLLIKPQLGLLACEEKTSRFSQSLTVFRYTLSFFPDCCAWYCRKKIFHPCMKKPLLRNTI